MSGVLEDHGCLNMEPAIGLVKSAQLKNTWTED